MVDRTLMERPMRYASLRVALACAGWVGFVGTGIAADAGNSGANPGTFTNITAPASSVPDAPSQVAITPGQVAVVTSRVGLVATQQAIVNIRDSIQVQAPARGRPPG